MGNGTAKKDSMRIGIDARLINESGIGRYIRNLLENLAILDSKNEYFILLRNPDAINLSWGANFQKVKADFKWYSIAEQVGLPKVLNKINPDLTHFPHFNIPIFFKGKFIVTIHDLIHQHYMMKRSTTLDPFTYKLKQLGYKKVFDFALKKSQKIIVPSQYVKSQLDSEWGIDKSKVIVTTEGVDESILEIKQKQSKKLQLKILEKIGVTKPYIFYVGNAHPHKNVEGLIKAFFRVKGEGERVKDLKLVLSGADHYFWKRIRAEFKHQDIIYTGYVTEEALVSLYSNAQIFVLPSFEEGFGIPILESFATGCPVVCSGIGALKEVAGDGAVYFDPENIDDIAEKMIEVLKNEKLKKKLTENGEKRVRDFSWKKLAQETLKIYLSS